MAGLGACPLCGGLAGHMLDCGDRGYRRCHGCGLVFLDPALRLDADGERAEYDLHCNDPADPGYRDFLARSLGEVLTRIPPPASGLDFGCGPGPALVEMAREAGYTMDAYDKFYAHDLAVFGRCYDFITCTEVVEHLASPCSELDRLWNLLRPGGVFVIQTGRVLDDTRFVAWNYRRDPTHIVFFADASFAWLAARWGAGLTLPHRDVAVLVKAD